MVLKLLFIRHAQSVANQQQRMQGREDDSLSEEGIHQAERLAQRLQAEFWEPSHGYCSPLRRSQQTAAILLRHLSLPSIDYADDLQEFQNGIFQGLTWTEAKAQYPDLCDRLESSPDWIPIPNAESLQDGRDRARRFIQQLLICHGNSDRLWIITHSWILQHIISEVLGCDRSWGISIPNTSLFEFWLDHSRWHHTDQNRFNTELWQIRRFNDYHHLTFEP